VRREILDDLGHSFGFTLYAVGAGTNLRTISRVNALPLAGRNLTLEATSAKVCGNDALVAGSAYFPGHSSMSAVRRGAASTLLQRSVEQFSSEHLQQQNGLL
jgi:hypothetical protein